MDALPLTGGVGGVKMFSDVAWHLICHCQVCFVICFLHHIMSYGYFKSLENKDPSRSTASFSFHVKYYNELEEEILNKDNSLTNSEI